jgi:hypothetical protein
MDEQARRPAAAKLERAIVLELLAEENDGDGGEDGVGSGESERGCSRSELVAALGACEAEIERALARLSDAGIVHATAETVSATPAARRLDELGLIGI